MRLITNGITLSVLIISGCVSQPACRLILLAVGCELAIVRDGDLGLACFLILATVGRTCGFAPVAEFAEM